MIDWSPIVLRLKNRGVSHTRLATLTGGCQQTIARLARGDVAQPKFDIGVKILDVHFDYCPDEHSRIVTL